MTAKSPRKTKHKKTTSMSKELHLLGAQIDAAADNRNGKKLFELDAKCIKLQAESQKGAGTLWYFRSNIYAALQDLQDAQSWDWRQPHRERQILYLRKALGCVTDRVRRAQITTNLANQLNTLGRSIEALALYDLALKEVPNFAMAIANRGLARMELAKLLYGRDAPSVFLLAAHQDFCYAQSERVIWDGPYTNAIAFFSEKQLEIENLLGTNVSFESLRLRTKSLGRTKKEKEYRQWALNHQLFLNPISLLDTFENAASDVLCLPDYYSDIDEPPQFIAWYNQLKQEFVGARYLYFESLHPTDNHFADQGVTLVNTLDYPVFGMSAEKMRCAFRTAYSLLDKVSGFINAYFEIGDRPDRVDFRNIWLDKQNALRPEFKGYENLPLRGLYWLSLDVLGKEPTDCDAIAPNAAHLHKIRNALEHRSLVIREYEIDMPMGVVETITLDKFTEDTLAMLKLAHASLIYLALAVGREERVRSEFRNTLAIPMPLPTYRKSY